MHLLPWSSQAEGKEDPMIEGLVVGRVVHFVPSDGRNPGVCRAAIVVKVWDPQGTGCSNLAVLYDGSNDLDSPAVAPGLLGPAPSLAQWRTSVVFDGAPTPSQYTWHLPTACPFEQAAGHRPHAPSTIAPDPAKGHQ